MWVATGLKKWGITSGTVAGELITDGILGRENPWSGLFSTTRIRPHVEAPRFLLENSRTGVRMVLDPEVDAAYPARWIGKVSVHTRDGRELQARVDEPKGDPGNTLSRAELEDKAIGLASYQRGASEAEMLALVQRVWSIAGAPRVTRLLG